MKDKESQTFYGMVKEVEGVVVKGDSEEEVKAKIPKAIKAIIDAKRKYSDLHKHTLNTKTMVVQEYEQSYVAC